MNISEKFIDGARLHRESLENAGETIHLKFTSLDSFSAATVKKGERQFIAKITTNKIDRDKEIVESRGISITNYQKNPIILFSHDARSLPIGRTIWLKRFSDQDGTEGLVAKGQIATGTTLGDEVWELLKQGILATTSIGFGVKESRVPSAAEIKLNPDLKGVERIISRSELFEFSIVAIPSNIDASIFAVSKMPRSMSEGAWPKSVSPELIGRSVPTNLITKSESVQQWQRDMFLSRVLGRV